MANEQCQKSGKDSCSQGAHCIGIFCTHLDECVHPFSFKNRYSTKLAKENNFFETGFFYVGNRNY